MNKTIKITGEKFAFLSEATARLGRELTQLGCAMAVAITDARRAERLAEARRLHRIGHIIRNSIINYEYIGRA